MGLSKEVFDAAQARGKRQQTQRPVQSSFEHPGQRTGATLLPDEDSTDIDACCGCIVATYFAVGAFASMVKDTATSVVRMVGLAEPLPKLKRR